MKKSTLDLTTIALFVLGLCYFFWSTLTSIHAHWSQASANYSHGYLLLITSIYLFYEARTRKSVTPAFKYWQVFAIALLASSTLWMLADLVQVQIIQQLSILAITYFFFAMIFGIQGAKDALFPVGLIVLAIPVWGSMTEVLQYLTVSVCNFGLSLLHIPAHIHEFYIQIPDGIIHVADSCSGLNYFLIAVSLGVIQAQLYCHAFWRKVLLTLTAATVGLLSNWIRVFSLIVIGHESKMQSSLMESHFWHGWIIFGLSLIPIFLVANKLKDEIPENKVVSQSDGVFATKRSVLVSCCALLLAFSGPLVLKSFGESESTFYAEAMSESLSEWKFQITETTDWSPTFTGVDETIAATLKNGIQYAQLDVCVYLDQHQGKELVYYKNSISDDQWQQVDKQETILDDSPLIVSRLVARQGRGEKALIYWYQVGNEGTNNKNEVKLLQLKNFLQGRSDAALIAISSDCRKGCAEAFEFLEELITPVKSAYSAASTPRVL